MILPKQNISIMDVRNCIGYPSMDLGTLCSAGETYINKWAKYKPVHHNFTTNRPSDWWKGTMQNCGINFLQHNTIQKLIESVNAGTSQHSYQSPMGGSTSPYRLGDFCGYNTESIAPLHAGNIEGTYYKNNNVIGVACLIRAEGISDELTVADIFGNQFENMYYAAALQRSDNTIMWMSCGSDIRNGGSFINIPTSGLTAGQTYYLYQFLSSYLKSSFTSGEQVGNFIAIPGQQKQAIKIESTNVGISLINIARSTNGVVTGNIRIDNRGGTTTYRNVSIQIRYSSSKPEDTLKVGEAIVNLSDINAPNNQITTVPFQSRTNVLPDFDAKGGKCILYMNNIVQAQGFILRPMPTN